MGAVGGLSVRTSNMSLINPL